VVAELADAGCTVDLHRLDGPDQVHGLVGELRANRVQRLILAGGDGLVHLALPALVEQRDGEREADRMVVGIVPLGTGNDFCRGLGLPTKRTQAVAAALSETVTPVDVIAIDYPSRPATPTQMAATVVTCGFSGRVNARANAMRFPSGGRRYTVATVAEMFDLQTGHYRLGFDDEPPTELDSLLVAVGNTPYFGGGMAVCPDASFRDGLLDVVLVADVATSTFARVLPRVFNGRHIEHDAVTVRRCRRLSITTTEPLWADGEQLRSPTAGTGPHDPGGDTAVEAVVEALPGPLLVAGIPTQ
jgi:diacylglycerol kinase (ATP)